MKSEDLRRNLLEKEREQALLENKYRELEKQEQGLDKKIDIVKADISEHKQKVN